MENTSSIDLGVVPTHLGFSTFIPNDHGELPRTDGELNVVKGMREIMQMTITPVTLVQMPYFPGTKREDIDEAIIELKKMGLKPHLILMTNPENDPTNPDHENAVFETLSSAIEVVKAHDIQTIALTAIEVWMSGIEKNGADLEAAREQVVKLYARLYREKIKGTGIKYCDIEPLRKGEMSTFGIKSTVDLVRMINDRLNEENPEFEKAFYRVLIDSAHVGDSGLAKEEIRDIITDLASTGELGDGHYSAPTSRGSEGDDLDGWMRDTTVANVKAGVHRLFAEVFRHDDRIIAPHMSKLNPPFGRDTTAGLDYTKVTAQNFNNLAMLVLNMASKGMVPPAQEAA